MSNIAPFFFLELSVIGQDVKGCFFSSFVGYSLGIGDDVEEIPATGLHLNRQSSVNW